jgi:hypothetical protein
MQPEMLGGRDLKGRAPDQRGQLFAGEPAALDAPTLGLRVELRSVGEASGCRVK